MSQHAAAVDPAKPTPATSAAEVDPAAAYQALAGLARERAVWQSTSAVLGWDQETYMPAAALEWRARQISQLSGRVHEISTSDRWYRLLEEASLGDDLTPTAAANVREWRRRFERDRKIPQALVEESSAASSRARAAWAEARRRSDFSRFAPHLKTLLGLQQQMAELWGYPEEPYDALLAGYERDLTARRTAGLFDQLEPELREIGREAAARSAAAGAPSLAAEYPLERQQEFNREIVEAFGFDFEGGRIDATTHPFCTDLGPGDVRLTTRYRIDDFTDSLFCVLHEAGHGMYEQGLPVDAYGTPAGESASLGIHESQSRLWENHIGRSRSFWQHWLPRARELFPAMPALDLDDWMKLVQKAESSFIRVEADESSYDLHVLLRFRLERELLSGELAVDEIPGRWNESFGHLFGMTPPDDARGCLQDIHWSMGGFGYFPTYTLGNLVAAQLFATASADPAVASGLDRADYRPLLEWMRREVHRHGATMDTEQIVRHATGRDLDPGHHLAHLRSRYLGPDA